MSLFLDEGSLGASGPGSSEAEVRRASVPHCIAGQGRAGQGRAGFVLRYRRCGFDRRRGGKAWHGMAWHVGLFGHQQGGEGVRGRQHEHEGFSALTTNMHGTRDEGLGAKPTTVSSGSRSCFTKRGGKVNETRVFLGSKVLRCWYIQKNPFAMNRCQM